MTDDEDHQKGRGLGPGARGTNERQTADRLAAGNARSGKKRAPKQPRVLTIVHKPSFAETLRSELHEAAAQAEADVHTARDWVLNSTLKTRLDEFCAHIIKEGLVAGHILYSQGVRSPRTAHLWSTAASIRRHLGEGETSASARKLIGNIRALKDGQDIDGNVWCGTENGKQWTTARIVAEADTILVRDGITGAAADGYPNGCPRRLPNIGQSLSNHLFGNAIDASIPWIKGWGGLEHTQTNKLIKAFGLNRPVKGERWHFELAQQAAPVMDFSSMTGPFFDFDLTTDELESPRILDFKDYEPSGGGWDVDN
jgi:hypothetical protein